MKAHIFGEEPWFNTFEWGDLLEEDEVTYKLYMSMISYTAKY